MSTKCAPVGAMNQPLVTIEPLKCCLCGKGIEAGKFEGRGVNGSFHPDCLSIDPFADSAETVEVKK